MPPELPLGSIDRAIPQSYGESNENFLTKNCLTAGGARFNTHIGTGDTNSTVSFVDCNAPIFPTELVATTANQQLGSPTNLYDQALNGARNLKIGPMPADDRLLPPGGDRFDPSNRFYSNSFQQTVSGAESQINQWLESQSNRRILPENLGIEIERERGRSRMRPLGQSGAYSAAQLDFLGGERGDQTMYQAAVNHNDAISLNDTLRQFLSPNEIRSLTRHYDSANAELTAADGSHRNLQLAVQAAGLDVGPPAGPHGTYSPTQVTNMMAALSTTGQQSLRDFQRAQTSAWEQVQAQSTLLNRGGVPAALDRLAETMPGNRMVQAWRRFFPAPASQ